MKVFLSAPPVTGAVIRSHALDLHRLGIETTSSWFKVPAEGAPDTATARDLAHTKSRVALALHEIEQSDIFVTFTPQHFHGWNFNPVAIFGGHNEVEIGYAISRGLPILIVGPGGLGNDYHRAYGNVVRRWDGALISLMARERDLALAAVAGMKSATR